MQSGADNPSAPPCDPPDRSAALLLLLTIDQTVNLVLGNHRFLREYPDIAVRTTNKLQQQGELTASSS
jgi:hypothetical protein